jgi:hypothetical protein
MQLENFIVEVTKVPLNRNFINCHHYHHKYHHHHHLGHHCIFISYISVLAGVFYKNFTL